MTSDDFINAIVTIGNHKRVIELCESNMVYHENIRPWMVKRILVALELMDEQRISEDIGGQLPEVVVSNTRAI